MDLSIQQIEDAAAGMKEDLQRKANQGILRNDLNRALTALAGIEHINQFVHLLEIRSRSTFDQYMATRRGRGRPAGRGRRGRRPPKQFPSQTPSD